MTLKMLTDGIKKKSHRGNQDMEITGISTDSRRVRSGELFVALMGGHFDGRDFVAEAVARGAAAVMHEGEVLKGLQVPYVCVPDARDALAAVSSRFYGRPSERLTLVGITGTNGKTTASYILRSILAAAGHDAGLIGTINYSIGEKNYPAPFTTPEPPEFQGLLKEMLDAGLNHVVAEVSSHALALKRVDHTKFSVAVFTNLTREHLDFHKDMDDYFDAKSRLFTGLLDEKGTAVVNLDDPYGMRLKLLLNGSGNVMTYGIDGGSDLKGTDIDISDAGLALDMIYRGESHRVSSKLMGVPNVYNVLSAAGAALALGVSWEAIAEGVSRLESVAGRFERVDLGQDFLLIVDYAHTDDALRRLIFSAREITRGRVITVFGCGGDRDRGKRPLMGTAASEFSDLVFVTSDNPRGEDPLAIIKDIEAGIKRDNCKVIPDRAEAIAEAVMAARASDTVLIAGKGHEDYQLVGDRRLGFSDRQVALEAVRKKMGA
jgi:UDP-N-acetylmuramoyl-L-alanyl-D-glutamate--2,6-diaminopimelate ligase